MAAVLAAYNAFLHRRPLMGQCLATAVLSGTGDVLAQQAVEKKGIHHDFPRTTRQTFWGGALLAPVVYRWFSFLQRLPIKNSSAALLARVGLDQVVFAPLSAAGFFITLATLEGSSPERTKERMDEAFVPTLLKGYFVFVPAQLVNFSVIPEPHRFAFIGGVRVLWNTYLSLVNARVEAQIAARKGLLGTRGDVSIPAPRPDRID